MAVVDLDRGRAESVAATLDGSIGLACDVADEDSVAAVVADTLARLGRIDCLFNAAGHAIFPPIEETTLAQWNRMLAVHATGTFLVCRAALPAMRASGGGSIVNVSSSAALIGRKNLGAYSGAKGAIWAFSRQLAVELADDHIRVNAIAPGFVRTGMTEPLVLKRGGGDFAKGALESTAGIPQQRVADPEEIAAPVCFLLSDEASFVTGTLVVADGGQTAV